MNWFEFAAKDDVRARRFFEELEDARFESGGQKHLAFVKAPKKVVLDGSIIHQQADTFGQVWDGMNWHPCLTYQSGKGLFVRLTYVGEV